MAYVATIQDDPPKCCVCDAETDFGQRGDGPAQQDGETGKIYCSEGCLIQGRCLDQINKITRN